MTASEELPSRLLILIALIQGLCLLLLHQSIELDYWPHNSPQWLFAFYSGAFVWPTVLLLGLTRENLPRLLPLSLVVGLVSALVGYYVGSQATPVPHISYTTLLWAFVLTMTIATFKALMYSQVLVTDADITYSALYRWSWRNFLTLSLSLLFALAFWLILMLWGGLFDAIGIDFFQELFAERWFYYPAIALANGFGVIIFRSLTQIIDSITRLQQALMKFLLVVLVLVSIMFLGALPFTGLEPLWESGGSSLILCMQALMLFFVSAVYQDDPNTRPYGLLLHRFIYIGVAILPIYSAISFYGLSLRVDQYGWTLARCWAYLIWFVLALFSSGYLFGILKLRDEWLHFLGKVNVAGGLVVLTLVLLVNSPLLDFRKFVVSNQMGRLASGDIGLDQLDVTYLRRSLARPGYLALKTLKDERGDDAPALVLRINALYEDPQSEKNSSSEEQFLAALQVISGDPSAELLTKIYETEMDSVWSVRMVSNYSLIEVELDRVSPTEFILVSDSKTRSGITLYYREEGKWLSKGVGRFTNLQRDELNEAILQGNIDVVPSRWMDLSIGGKIFRVQ